MRQPEGGPESDADLLGDDRRARCEGREVPWRRGRMVPVAGRIRSAVLLISACVLTVAILFVAASNSIGWARGGERTESGGNVELLARGAGAPVHQMSLVSGPNGGPQATISRPKPVVAQLDFGSALKAGPTCSDNGKNCNATKCCNQKGMQCYQKQHNGFASCKFRCSKGKDTTDPNPEPWTCNELGGRTPGEPSSFYFAALKLAPWVKKRCSAVGKDCRATQCCQDPGLSCFRKHSTWAACKSGCTPGLDLTDGDPHPWTCERLGPHNPGQPPASYWAGLKAAKWVKKRCSAQGKNCLTTKCCKDPGMTCFRKHAMWAACKHSCSPGPDPTDRDSHPWECSAVGSATPGVPSASYWAAQKAAPWVSKVCATNGEDCSKRRCCKDPGNHCFIKSNGWAMCRASCTPGPFLQDTDPHPWNCSTLGARTPGFPPRTFGERKVSKWVRAKCTTTGSCLKTKCCRGGGMQCYEKNAGWAACSVTCEPGIHANDPAKSPWSCKKLGERTPRKWKHPSLFCFSVMRATGYEPSILRTQVKKQAGIFACDEYAVMCNKQFSLGEGPAGDVVTITFTPAPVGISKDGTAANTQLFLNVWDAVKLDGRYRAADWTIKVDPDAVLVPVQLRKHLGPHTGLPTYIIDCNKAFMTPMMFGAVEAISLQAMNTYYAAEGRCKNLDWSSWGEDWYMQQCFNLLGIRGSPDFSMVADGVCTGVNCGNGAAAFHPFKDATRWLNCWNTAGR